MVVVPLDAPLPSKEPPLPQPLEQFRTPVLLEWVPGMVPVLSRAGVPEHDDGRGRAQELLLLPV